MSAMLFLKSREVNRERLAKIHLLSHKTGSMLIPRICAGASAGKTILPTAASNVPAQLRERLSAHKQPFRVRGRYSRRASGNRGPRFGATVNSGETNALALRVLRATAQYSICGWGLFCAPSTDYVPVYHEISKALGISQDGCSKISRGKSVVSSRCKQRVALKSRFHTEKPRRKSLSFERTSPGPSGLLNSAKSVRHSISIDLE